MIIDVILTTVAFTEHSIVVFFLNALQRLIHFIKTENKKIHRGWNFKSKTIIVNKPSSLDPVGFQVVEVKQDAILVLGIAHLSDEKKHNSSSGKTVSCC